ncbi:MAG: glucose-6-phosphate dehydrogenase [Candidatus Taylorbacteria bacterium]|nr:glucose-6-phosphate dehydrogenase [Candidatus Taylorbacteria bacterium]
MNNAPTIFVIFGITGDLSLRKLLPALLSLYVKKALPAKFSIVGFSRRAFTREEFRQLIRDEINIKPGQYQGEEVKHFLDHISYEQGFFDDLGSYDRLAQTLKKIDEYWKQCSNKLFHLSVSPVFYEKVLTNLAQSGLTISCNADKGWTRVLVEKPFGNDLETAQKLDALLGKLFEESQIFRIDHYLAKEAIQNILAFRFVNSLFEPLWNNKFIECVEVKLLEKIGVEGRGSFYDGVGAIRDVGQNHILQMLAIIAMEHPEDLSSEVIRAKRAQVLKNLVPITEKTVAKVLVRGQYEGYLTEPGVKHGSETETYFKLIAYINNKRWSGTPFLLESGKSLYDSKVEINVYFKNESDPERTNVLTFRIQPAESIQVRFWVKTPGFGMKIEPKTLSFKYSDFNVGDTIPDAYERVILDAVHGDQTLFASTEEVKYAWKFITPLVKAIRYTPLKFYKKGSKHVE